MNLDMNFCIGSSVPFLDVEINHRQGILQTKIYRPCLTEPYTLSYLVNYPLEFYMKMIRIMLIRAIHCCTNVHDFHDEHKFIYVTSLINRFPLDFIDTCIREFFKEFNPTKLDYHYSQQAFKKLRRHVITTERLSMLSINNERSWYDNKKDDYNFDSKTNTKKRMKTYSN